MDTLANLQKYANSEPEIRRFTSWRDLFVDLILAVSFSIAIISWTHIIIEAGGLICVSWRESTYTLDISEQRFSGSVCQLGFASRMLLFYPYYCLFTLSILFIAHIIWAKIPSVTSKLSNYYILFLKIGKLDPKFLPNSNQARLLPLFEHGDRDPNYTKILHDRLLFMLLDKSYLMNIYVKKTRLTTAFSFFFILTTITWIWISNFGESTFSCEPELNFTEKVFPQYTCDVSPSVFIYGAMVFHLSCLVFLFLISLYSSFVGSSFKSYFDVFSGDENYDRYKSLPGINDFIFCISFVQCNMRNGLFIFNAIKYVLLQSQVNYSEEIIKEEKYVTNEFNIDQENIDPDVKKKKERNLKKFHKFDEGAFLVRYITYQLGLKEIPNDQQPGHLYKCIEEILKRIDQFNLLWLKKTIREAIIEEIINNRDYYKLILDMVDCLEGNQYLSVKVTYSYSKLKNIIEHVSNKNLFAPWIVLAAASNILKIRIVLIHAGKSYGAHSPFIIDEFQPYSTGNIPQSYSRNSIDSSEYESDCLFGNADSTYSNGTFFLTYLYPYYYHHTALLAENTIEREVLRQKYANSFMEREELRHDTKKEIDNTDKYRFKGNRRKTSNPSLGEDNNSYIGVKSYEDSITSDEGTQYSKNNYKMMINRVQTALENQQLKFPNFYREDENS